ncbi:MAG: aspartate aminotransferase family protein [Candidatus Kapaibacterium sp.]
MRTVTEQEHELFLQTYKRLPVEIDRAEGMYVYAKDGRRYLDFLGGIAVNAAGHSHPRIIRAVVDQMNRYAHVSNFFYQDAQVSFVEKLTRLSRYDRAFLCNSGTEATDGALKLVRRWGSARQKSEVIAFTGGFHGRGYGALSIMDKPKYKEGMGPFLSGTEVLPFNDLNGLAESVNESTAAVFIEFLQGEGGIRWADREFVQLLEDLREKYGFLIVADEVQGGGGRTGTFFSFEHFNVRPDIVTTAKVIGGGLPLGAILTTESLADVFDYGRHGTTFGGNAVACAAGSALLDLIDDGLMEQIKVSGSRLIARLKELATEFPERIADVRGAGAMVGIELKEEAAPIVEQLLGKLIIANATNETVIRLLPPYIFGEEHVEELIVALREVLT